MTKPLHGAKVVSTRHFASQRGSSSVARVAGRAIARLIDAQVAISKFVQKAVESETALIYSGVEGESPYEEFLNDEPRVAGRENVILVVQRLEAEKDTETAIRAFGLSGLANDGWQMHIVGTGAELDRLTALCEELGLANSCTFFGYQDDVDRRMRSASIFLATTSAEGLGLSVLEAMSHGLPTIAAASGGHVETVGLCKGARLFPASDSAQAAVHLRELASNRAERLAYGHALKRLQADQFGIDRQVEETLALYGSLSGRR